MKHRRTIRTSDRSGPRRGAILLMVMICLLIATLILGTLLKTAMTHRRQMRSEQMRMQADWLVESAIERAVHHLETDPNYQGETWTIPAADLNNRDSGRVRIAIRKPADGSAGRILNVEAIYPVGTPRQAKRTKQISVR